MYPTGAPTLTHSVAPPQADFCPPLDSALLTAILSDFPTPTTADEIAIRKTLSTLSAASEDEPPEIDGSGTSEIESALEAWNLDEDEERAVGGGDGHDDPVAFLTAVFPKLQGEALWERLANAGGNVESLVEELLSEEFILSSSSGSSSSTSSSDAPSPPTSDASSSPRPSKSAKRREKAFIKASSTLSLTSPRLLLPPPRQPQSIPPSDAYSTSNLWVSLDSLSLHLATLLDVPPGTITSFFHSHPSSSPPVALRAFIDQLAATRPPRSWPSIENFLQLLGAEVWETERGEIALRACEGRVGDAVDLVEVLKDGDSAGGGPSSGFAREFHPPTTPRPPLAASSSSARARPPPVPPPLARDEADSRASFDECQALAQDYTTRRNDAYRAGARHFQKGSRGDRGAAWYWADQGREMGRLARVWEGKAARALVGSRR